jgi:hypothetical protein
MAKHSLMTCGKINNEIKNEYRKELERAGKYDLPNIPRNPDGTYATSKFNSASSEDDEDPDDEVKAPPKKRKAEMKLSPNDSTESLINLIQGSTNNENRSMNKRASRGQITATETPSFLRPPSNFSFEELLLQILLECNLNNNLLNVFENAFSFQELCHYVPDFVPFMSSSSLQSSSTSVLDPINTSASSSQSLFPNSYKLIYKIIPELERKYYSNLASILGTEGKWTLLLTSQILMSGLIQFFIFAKCNEMIQVIGTFKLSLDSTCMNNHGLMIETLYTNIWNRIDSLSISRSAFISTVPYEFYLSSNGLSPMVAVVPLHPSSAVVAQQNQNPVVPGGIMFSGQNQSNPAAPIVNHVIPQLNNSLGVPSQGITHLLNPTPQLVQPAQTVSPHYHFLRIDLKDADPKLLSIPCIFSSLQTLLRYFATIVKPLSMIKEVFMYLLHHPIWLSAINNFLLSRNQYIPAITTLTSKDYLFSLYYCFDMLYVYLYAIREILPSEAFNKYLPPITPEITEIINNPNHMITLRTYCNLMKPVVESIESLLAAKESVTLAHSLRVLLHIESSLLQMNFHNEAFANEMRKSVLTQFHDICNSYDLDLFIVSLFLWPRYKGLVISKKYDYLAVRQGILRLANSLKCFVADQAFQLVREIEAYRNNSPPFNFTEEQLDLEAKQLWGSFPDQTNVLCITAKKLFDVTAISYSTNKEIIRKYNSFMNFHDEVISEKLLFLSYYHSTQNIIKRNSAKENSLFPHSAKISSNHLSSGTNSIPTASTNSSPTAKHNPSIFNGGSVQSTSLNTSLSNLSLPPLTLPAIPLSSSNTSPMHRTINSLGHVSQPSFRFSTANPPSITTATTPLAQSSSLPLYTASFPSPLNVFPNPMSIDDVSLTWIDNEIKNIQLLQEKVNNDMAFRTTRRVAMDELFDLNTFLQIENVVKVRQESAAVSEHESAMMKAQQYDWDPSLILADYERSTKG